MKKTIITLMLLVASTTFASAQLMKSADLEKYAKERYGDKWLDAAKNLSTELTLDKNESLTYQQIIEVPGKTKNLPTTLNATLSQASPWRSPAQTRTRTPRS